MKKALFAAVCATALSTGAWAQDLEAWGSSEYWDVMIDPSLGYGCLIQSEFQDGSLVRVGYDRADEVGYVAVFNYEWQGIEDGAYYPITFELDRNQYDADAFGYWWGDAPGAIIPFDNDQFLFDIAKKYTMTIYTEDGYLTSFDLTGSYRALEAATTCQDEIGW
ncbi:MAG: hypothetical protein AAGP08_06215 [Pseudomonadota bacterium]